MYWRGCIDDDEGWEVICQQTFLKLAAVHVPFKIPLRTASKSSFVALVPRSNFGAAVSAPIVYVKVSLCKSLLCVNASLCKDFSV